MLSTGIREGSWTRPACTRVAAGLVLLTLAAQAVPLKVDLGIAGRPDTGARHFVEWRFDAAAPHASFGEIHVALRPTSAVGALNGVLWKAGLDGDARVASDGVRASRGGLELVLSNLPPGVHTLATFHNWIEPPPQPLPPLEVYLNGKRVLDGVRPTCRVTNDADMASAYIRFAAAAGREIVIRFQPAAGSEGEGVILNGFELNASDPAARASRPVPADGDEHVAAEQGAVTLRWSSPKGVVAHELYFGTNASEVATVYTKVPSKQIFDRYFGTNSSAAAQAAAAFPRSPLYQGILQIPAHTVDRLDHLSTYYWRVDESHASGKFVRGEAWRFRIRHLAFPSAEGYGRFAIGGRGGRVIEVTNLNDSGPGSLRAAVEAEGPRTAGFSVSGLITLESRLIIRNPYLTIAGQTAPGKGICIRNYNLGMLGAHDVIIRYLRVRPGDAAGVTLDGMGMAGCDHCIIDHCSISWSQDEVFSSRGAKNITLQRSLLSEALNAAGHKNYPAGTQHGYAASISGMIGSFHHNLLAHCAGRNWSLAGGLNQGGRHTGWLDIRNNVVYNWRHRTTDGGAAQVQFVNNYYKPGPASKYFYVLNPERNNIQGFGPQMYFVEGNVMEGRYGPENPLEGVTRPEPYEQFIVPEPFFEPHVRPQTAREAYEDVLANVGCNRPALDDHDRRVIQETRDGAFRFSGSRTGLPGLPDSQNDVGGWEDYPEIPREPGWDADHDGMADAWEKRAGLDPAHAEDGALDRDRDGYTNLEEYLGWLAGEFADPDSPAPPSASNADSNLPR